MDLIRARTWTSRPSVSADMATLGHSLRPGEGKSVLFFRSLRKVGKSVATTRGAAHLRDMRNDEIDNSRTITVLYGGPIAKEVRDSRVYPNTSIPRLEAGHTSRHPPRRVPTTNIARPPTGG